MSCPYQALTPIGGYLLDLRRQKVDRLQNILDRDSSEGVDMGWNITVFHLVHDFDPGVQRRFRVQRLTVQELINQAKIRIDWLTNKMQGQDGMPFYMRKKKEDFRNLMDVYLNRWAQQRGVIYEDSLRSPYSQRIKREVIEALEDIMEVDFNRTRL